jgi:serine/threonine protein kinase
MAQAIASIAVFVETLRQHQLIGAEEWTDLTSLQRRCSDPRDLAREILRRNWLTPYQVNQLLQGNVSDLFIGHYLVLERLDEGGQGQIFKARHRNLERVVALKVLHKSALDDPEILARFQRESKVIRQLHHPNIVLAYDSGQMGTNVFLAMEFVEGVNLWQLVKKHGPPSPATAAEYIRQAALGLQHIHERGLVHRDIKPSNLVLARTPQGGGIIKILDLGLARRMQPIHGEATEKLTTDQSGALGTVDYMSPEQALDFHRADIRADIYSLGYTFYFLLTGVAPFGSATVAQKLIWHQQREPTPVQELAKDVPASFVQILKQMTAKNPADRFQVPGDVARALGGQPVSVPLKPPSAPIARIVIDPAERLRPPSNVAVRVPTNTVSSIPTAPPAPVPVKKKRSLRKIAIVGGLVGIAGLILFSVVFAAALRKKDTIVQKTTPGKTDSPDKNPPDKTPPDKNPERPDDPKQQPSGVALLAFDKGQLPNDTGTSTSSRFFSIEDHPPLGRALKVAFPANDSFGHRVGTHLTDWTTYTGLQFDIVNPGKESHVLHFNLLHRRSTNYQTRVDVPFFVKTGRSKVKIPIPPMMNTNGTAPDLAGIVRWFITVEGGKAATFYFGNLWLEGGDVVIQGKPHVRDVLLDAEQPSKALGGIGKTNAIRKGEVPSVFLVSFDVENYQAALRARIVENATLSFYVWDPSNTAKTMVKAYPVLTPWQEGHATWLSPMAGKEWRGKPPKPGGVCAFEIGVDTGPAAPAGVVVLSDPPGMDTVEPPIEYQLDVTDIVRNWLEKKQENHGIAIAGVPDKDTDGGLNTRFQMLASEHERAQYTPKLHIRLKR